MPGPVDFIALEAARDINDVFARGHQGGVAQRTAAVQVIVAKAIQTAFEQATQGLISAQPRDAS